VSPLRTLLAAPAGVIALTALLVAASVLLVLFGVEVGSTLSPVVDNLRRINT
jgi:hypothetical protein